MTQATPEGFRLSPQQQHLWLCQGLNASSPYQVQGALHITGPLEVSRLREAVETVVTRHEILRTTFDDLPGMSLPLQIIGDRLPLWKTATATPESFPSLLAQQRQVPIGWTEDSLTHLTLITLSRDRHVLAIRLPALCADEITLFNFAKEIGASYAGMPLAEEPLQYADIAEWQYELLEAEETATGRAYWQQQTFEPLGMKLPWGKSGEGEMTFTPHCQFVSLAPDLVTTLTAIASSQQVPLSTLLLTSWQGLLGRLTGDLPPVLGVSVTGRHYEELQGAFGCFAKHLPVKGHLQENQSILSQLRQTHTTLETARQWQDYLAWNELHARGQPFLPLTFDWIDCPAPFTAAGLSWAINIPYCCRDRFALQLTGQQREQALILQLYYNEQQFCAPEIDRLQTQFITLLESFARAPEAPLNQLNFLSERERHHLLVELNQTRINYPQANTIHQLIEAQVERTPEAIAVRDESGQALSYHQLNTQANQLAHYLQRQGVREEVPVALFLKRSVKTLVALLGILKAGGAYVPLEPALPKDAIAFRLQNARAPIVITEDSLLNHLPPLSTQPLILEHLADTLTHFPHQTPPTSVKGENLAYLIYTSGSTGQPKGVAVEHRQLLNYVQSIQERLNLQPGFHYALVSTLAADLGNTMIFPALCCGGCLHLLSSESAKNPNALASYAQQHPIDCLKIVPSHLQALLASEHAAQFLPRQRLILGGETSSRSLIEQVQPRLAPTCQLFNHYGPTETTVGVLTHAIEFPLSSRKTIPLGRPLGNTQVYLFDEHQQLVPAGVTGELYVGGASVARGYWQDEALTAQCFISHPTQGRLYKTGDLGCYLPDGTITFFGRKDRQVKLHGFRVELGEIEAVTAQHQWVQQVVMSLREETLVGYVQWSPDTPSPQAGKTALQDYLGDRLPPYLIPTAWVSLTTFPLTANSKVDHQALPAPTQNKPTYVAPRTPQEQGLCEIWAEVLGVESVGIEDNFLALGGDSILSIRAIAKATQQGISFTPQQLFEHPTIAELVTVASSTASVEAARGLIEGTVVLTPIQTWFFEQNFAHPHHWNQAVLLTVRASLEVKWLQQGLQALLNHHDALRLRFVHQQGEWQGIHAHHEQPLPWEVIDLSELSPSEQAEAIATHANHRQTQLNLTERPLLQVVLFELGKGQPPRLLIVVHHLVIDGVSWRILLEDLQTAIQQQQQGQPIQLPPKTTSFQQWSNSLRTYRDSPSCQGTLDHWLHQLQQPFSPLPVDRQKGANTVASSHTVSVTLSSAETQALLQEVPEVYQTQINDVLLTALAQTWQQETGHRDLRVVLEGHGREFLSETLDVSRTVGWFTTMFPVHLEFPSNPDPGAALKAIKEQLRQIPHNGIDYGILRYLAKTPSLQNLPEASVRFNYLGQFDPLLGDSSSFALASEASGVSRSPQGLRPYLIDLNSRILDGCLHLDWVYSDAFHATATIKRWAEGYLTCLRSLIAHCQSPDAGGYTPSDFPEMALSQGELDELLETL